MKKNIFAKSETEYPYSIVLQPLEISMFEILQVDYKKRSGPCYSNLTTSLVNVTLKFQTLISEIRHYFLLKKM